jgi:hypothetical protein
MSDVFGILELDDSFGNFQYSEKDWKKIKAVVEDKFGLNADEVQVHYLDFIVPLRGILEIEIGLYRFKNQFENCFPPQTRKQILPELKRFQRVLLDLRLRLKTPEIALFAFDWGNDRGGPKSAIQAVENWLQQLRPKIDWLSRTLPNEPFPGIAAPADTTPAEGLQRLHRDLTEDPDGHLVRGVLRIFVRAFEQRPGITDQGPAFQLLQAALHPEFGDLTDGRILYWLRKFAGEF